MIVIHGSSSLGLISINKPHLRVASAVGFSHCPENYMTSVIQRFHLPETPMKIKFYFSKTSI